MLEKNKIEGNENVFVGGNLIINVEDIKSSDNKLYKIIQNKLESIDCYVAQYISGVKAHNKKDPERFNSTVILESMGRLGIPITAGIKTISTAVNIITKRYSKGATIETSNVRKAITESLYGLDESEYGGDNIDRWAESYIRRYGTETLIKVIGDPDGEKLNDKDLVINYLINNLLPEVMRSISEDIRKIDDTSKIASKGMLRRMAGEILEAVHSLNLYRIHYDVLFSLVKEMALQPPHPWFSPKARSYLHVNYDYEKYKKNFRIAMASHSKGDNNKLLYALKETTHHCCSSILAYYSVYMGCGTLAPLHVLIEILHDICREGASDSEALFRIDEIKSDLKNLNIGVEKLNTLLKRIKKKLQSNIRSEDLTIESLYHDVKELTEITTTIIASFIRKQRHRIMCENRDDLCLDDIFLGFPYLEWEWHESQEAFWITQHYKTVAFSQIKPRILVVPLDETENISHIYLEKWFIEAQRQSLVCNLLFFITKHQLFDTTKIITDDKAYGINIVSLTFDEMIDASSEEKPWSVLDKLLVNRVTSV